MTEVTSPYANGTPCWVDLMTPNREAALEFYQGLFGWDFEVGPPETGHYTTCKVRGLPAAGIGEPPPGQEATPVAWTTYLAVDDADAAVDRIKNAGGSVFMDPMDVMEEGRMAIAADPTGAVFGLWQPGRHFGARIVNEPGAFCWNEVLTRDAAAAKEFYRTVFGYGLEALEDEAVDYTTLKIGDRGVAGLMAMGAEFPAEVPPHWMTYFAVADTDETVRQITERGGTVISGPMDSPFGRFAGAVDPQGASFSVIALAPPPEAPTT